MLHSTALTGSELNEFMDGFQDPEDGMRVLNGIWNSEREAKLKEYQEFVNFCKCPKAEKKEVQDWIKAARQLLAGNTDVFHEMMDRIIQWVYGHGYEPIINETDLMYRGRA